jgi:hypothetical protein
MKAIVEQWLTFGMQFSAGLIVGAFLWGSPGTAADIGKWVIVLTLVTTALLRRWSGPGETTTEPAFSVPQFDRLTFYPTLIAVVVLVFLYAYFSGMGDPVSAAQLRAH